MKLPPKDPATRKRPRRGKPSKQDGSEATQRHSDDLAGLDSGEREAILLAGELNALLIIDEAEGRKRAVAMGLRVTGILGMMLESKARGLIDQVAPELARLVTVTTFRISEELREGVLKLAGESESNP
jgi:predicted nucleic acid-binding protein